MKKLWFIVLTGLFLMLAACGQGSDESENNGGSSDTNQGAEEITKDHADYIIGVTQYVEHPSLDRALDGFQQSIEDAGIKAYFDINYAQADSKNNSSIADKLVGDQVDLIFANSTPSALSALNATREIPIVFTSVTDPVDAGLVSSLENPGGNITGTTDSHPEAIPKTLSFMKEMGISDVGMIYTPSEPNSVIQIEQAKESAAGLELNIHEATVASSSEVKQAAESLIGDVDAFYIITDNTVVSALESVLMIGQQEDLPVFAGEHDSVERGSFAAYGFDYYDIGYEAGEKAVQILTGEKEPGEISVSFPQKLTLLMNQTAAAEMGVEIEEAWKENAEIIE
ncbi:putative ABC transport system substrate-binding protein [Melghiribacillus thermohalophilus]|uniref:Putative ABC transport system substrate-binding protein n=2 Tax=Melghiribacillus thermohalophilus TaxID=1324956 RepID=A0A4R3MN86_9BACI|nr:putative ABC transport system substrate-binding protein [Melghiribacillus thermohalophilus]